ncbi:MAG: gamma-glutamyltransferase [Candidatus Eisenbacteria sp.]|nr:gamma-glutamyltransferase [Candidatus Eisenbacteria bacterium]
MNRVQRTLLAIALFVPGAFVLGAVVPGAFVPSIFVPAVVWAASPLPAIATDGMVVTESPPASWVGAEILREGGNAIDAAIATHFALAVTYPEAGNLGGGGFLLLNMADGTREAIDFREIAPGAATRDLFLGPDGRPDPELSTATLFGTGVPGAVAGMALAHERHATLPWKALLEPAIRLAREGFVLDRHLARKLRVSEARLGRHPESRRVFLRDGDYYAEGDTLRQPELAATLERIAREGPREFYEGATAESLLAEVERGGGLITAVDLRDYRAKVRGPLQGSYRGRTILTMPPPSSGGVAMLQMLGMLERFPLAEWGALSSQTLHVMAEVMRHAFADRAEFLGDPDFTSLPVAGLIARGYIDSLAQAIDLGRATPSLGAGPGLPAGAGLFYEETGDTPGADLRATPGAEGPAGQETTHFNIVDSHGNAVAVTTTLNTSFGTGIMVTGAGFLLNNELDDFAAAPGVPNYYGLIQGEANAVRPYARPLSSMTPTLVLEEDRVVLALGSPGGPRIITAVLQSLINVIDHGMHVQEAIDAPRVHHQWWPDTLYAEPRALVADVREALRLRGQPLGGIRQVGSMQGIQVVARPGETPLLLGAADPRRNGCAVGISGGRLVSDCPCSSRP